MCRMMSSHADLSGRFSWLVVTSKETALEEMSSSGRGQSRRSEISLSNQSHAALLDRLGPIQAKTPTFTRQPCTDEQHLGTRSQSLARNETRSTINGLME